MKICPKCKHVLESGKLYCGNCGVLGIEMETEKSQTDASEEKTKDQEVASTVEKKKLVDMRDWEKASPVNTILNSPKIPRVLTIIKVIGVLVLIGVCASLLVSAIDMLKNDELPEEIMLILARPKWEKFINVLFIGALVLYLLLWVPYVKLYLLISKRNFIKNAVEKAKREGIETESHGNCLKRLVNESEDFGDAYAYLLAHNQTNWMKELVFSVVTICGKLLEIIFMFVFANDLLDKILVPTPSLNITYFLAHPSVWVVIICMAIDIFVPSFRDVTLVSEELERYETKDIADKK